MQVTDPRIGAFLRLGAGRMASVASPKWAEILASMSPIGQRPFVECTKQGALALKGRGAGGSYAVAAKFHRPSAAHPGCSSVFVAQSSARAREILSPAVWKLNEKFQLGITERMKDNCFLWPNGYKVLLRGCSDSVEVGKRRGTPWVYAGWDEAASIRSDLLREDIHSAVEPRLADYNGLWFVCGSPGPIMSGYWHELSNGNNPHYPVFEWDARTNRHMNATKYFIDTLQRMQGVPDRKLWPAGVTSLQQLIDDPKHWHLLPATFVREYLGKWVTDLKALIYRISPGKNTFSELPIEPDYWTIGCDLGANSEEDPDLDHAAITVACSNQTLPYVWVLESFRMSDVTTDSLAARLCQLCEQYPEAAVHIDSASAGKLIENTFKKMGIPIQAALKGPKLRRIQLLQSALGNGNLQLHITRTMDLRHESTALAWNERRDSHSERCADDCWDSCHYAVLPHLGDHEQQKDDTLEPGTAEWERAQELEEFERAIAEAEQA